MSFLVSSFEFSCTVEIKWFISNNNDKEKVNKFDTELLTLNYDYKYIIYVVNHSTSESGLILTLVG